MKESNTHAGLAIIISFFMYALSFMKPFEDVKRNWLFVVFMLVVMGALGYFYAKLFYDDRGDSHKKI